MSAKDCPHDSFAWDSWYHCMACEEQRQQQEKDAEWNAAIEAAKTVVMDGTGRPSQKAATRDALDALKREVKP